MIRRITAFILAILMYLMPWLNLPGRPEPDPAPKSNYTNVFVHGLGGWGEEAPYYDVMPYWGMFGGDLMKYLSAKGYPCATADVTPGAGCWDRACELYAQLTGTRVDYGKAHAARCHHSRYGKNYKYRAIVDKFSSEDKINLYGHSFGGATILQFLQLMYAGSEEERRATTDGSLSGLFQGGKGGWIHSIFTLSAPMNGTTAYTVRDVINEDPDATEEEKQVVFILTNGTAAPRDGRIKEDSAEYDMYVDHAMALCDSFETLPFVYYFSVPCQLVTQNPDGTWSPREKEMEPLFRAASRRIGSYTGVTPNGYVIDESWQMNDGLVNTKSAMAPFGAPQQPLDRDHVQPGVWNILPTHEGDHMSLMGGLLKKHPVKELYLDFLQLVCEQP